MSYRIKCLKCNILNDFSSIKKNQLIPCRGCKSEIHHCGPLPVPVWDMALHRTKHEEKVHVPEEKELNQLPKWVCPWCGKAVESESECKACGTDLNKTGYLSLWHYSEGLTPFECGLYFQQANELKDTQIMLCRLNRLDDSLKKRAKNFRDLPATVQDDELPPGYKYSRNQKRTWWKFWKKAN